MARISNSAKHRSAAHFHFREFIGFKVNATSMEPSSIVTSNRYLNNIFLLVLNNPNVIPYLTLTLLPRLLSVLPIKTLGLVVLPRLYPKLPITILTRILGSTAPYHNPNLVVYLVQLPNPSSLLGVT